MYWESRNHHPNVSFIFQRTDNRGTVILPDPRLQFMYPDESRQQAERRVKIESAMVKVYGEPVNTRSALDALMGRTTPGVAFMQDGDAFVVEFPLDANDTAGRRSVVVVFGYLPLNSYADAELHWLYKFCDSALNRGPTPDERERFIFALDKVGKLKPRSPRRPPFVSNGATNANSRIDASDLDQSAASSPLAGPPQADMQNDDSAVASVQVRANGNDRADGQGVQIIGDDSNTADPTRDRSATEHCSAETVREGGTENEPTLVIDKRGEDVIVVDRSGSATVEGASAEQELLNCRQVETT